MSMSAFFRIARGPYRLDLSGKGAEMFGGRWNPVGTSAVYAASSIPLSMLETLVHAKNRPLGYYVMALDVPVQDAVTFSIADLPDGWDRLDDPSVAQSFALECLFASRRFGILVPSVVVPEVQNLVLNPLHPKMQAVSIRELRPLVPDPRLF